ncbi:MAG: shikimate kinase [Pseudomonadota bacterium]
MVGMMGAGKTAIGQALARRLEVPFLDSDAEIVAAANASIAEIFEGYGEAFFRDKEAKVIARLLAGPAGVLSTGGGAYLSDKNRALISEAGVAVWLKADLDLLWARVRHKDTRPLLRTDDPYATLKEIYEARTPLYAQADVVVAAQPGYSIGDMTDRVIDALSARPDVLALETT